MFTLNRSGLDAFLARIDEARALLPQLVQDAVQAAGETLVAELSSASPRGKSEGPPPEGDGDGPLADSFFVQAEEPPPGGAAISVRTTQPTKLGYVRYGTGVYGPRGERIRPTTKKALFWPGADHPVPSVAGMRPNDFVQPALDNAPNAEETLGVVFGEIVVILEG